MTAEPIVAPQRARLPLDNEAAGIPNRRQLLQVFALQGMAGLLLLVTMTLLRWSEPALVLDRLRPYGPSLIPIFFGFALILSLLKFELADRLFVSFVVTAYVAMFPILGLVLSAWIAVIAPIATRLLSIAGVGPVKIDMRNPGVELARTFSLFGIYGVPVIAATYLYELLGGRVPVVEPSLTNVVRISVAGIGLVVINSLLLSRTMRAYGYRGRRIWALIREDSSVYILTIPFAACMAISYASIGLGAILGLAFTAIVANGVARKLAAARGWNQKQLSRLASLSNIGKTVSLRFTTEQLLQTIYFECKKVLDVSLFSIALLDESTLELSFELDVRNETNYPRSRIPLGDGLNSWVVRNRQPLLIGTVKQERRLGVVALEDGIPSESWLGVPMMSRDKVIGVISIQSPNKNAFTKDDILLLTSIANQAAVALENAELYKDLEGLTLALEHRVKERTNELRETNLRLMTADRIKNQFLAKMSHELRTPLNSIIGFSSVLVESARETLPPRLLKFVENIRTAGYHLLELINDILDLSKIEAGKVELRPGTFDLRETVASVERVMKGFAEEAQVKITTTVDPGVPMVKLDEGRLKQILFNLLSNAVKFSPGGGPVDVSVHSIPASQSPLGVESVKIDVGDEGVGIAEADMKRIFEEFYQTEHGRRAAGGTGLGLSLTRNFVELHHGTIEVRSTLGQGSTFTLYLPIDCQADSNQFRLPSLHPAGGSPAVS